MFRGELGRFQRPEQGTQCSPCPSPISLRGGGGREGSQGPPQCRPSGSHLPINTPLSEMVLEHLMSSFWEHGSVGLRILCSRRLPAEPPRSLAPHSAPVPTSLPFPAEFVSITELPTADLKYPSRSLEERCIARSKSFELFPSPRITEQRAIVCLNLLLCGDRLQCFPFSLETGT